MDIRFYDFEFNFLCIVHEVISSDWYLKYNGIGTFEAHFAADREKISSLLENKYVIAVQGDLQAIITAKQICGQELILYGRTVNWILSKRVTPNFSTYNLDIGTNAEDISRWVVSSAFADVENFTLADKAGLDFEKHFWRNVYNPTSEVVTDCLDNAGAGHRVIFDRDTQTWIFEIYKGQEIPLLIAVGNKNAYTINYSEDLQNYCCEGWYERFEGSDEEAGVWESIVSDESKSGIYRWEGVLSGNSQSEATSALKNKKWTRECEVASSDLRYGSDYSLGDIVRVQYEFSGYKVSTVRRIIGVKIWCENSNYGEMPIFSDV